MSGESSKVLLEDAVDPVILVDQYKPGELRVSLQLTALDPNLNEQEGWGLVVSDLITHIASVYVAVHGGTERERRDAIVAALLKANDAKNEDPSLAENVLQVIATGKPPRTKLH